MGTVPIKPPTKTPEVASLSYERTFAKDKYTFVCSCGSTSIESLGRADAVFNRSSNNRVLVCCGCGARFRIKDDLSGVEYVGGCRVGQETKQDVTVQKVPYRGVSREGVITDFFNQAYGHACGPLPYEDPSSAEGCPTAATSQSKEEGGSIDYTKATGSPAEAAAKYCFDYVDTLAEDVKFGTAPNKPRRTIRDMKPGEYGYIPLHLVGKDPCMSTYVNPEPGGVACVRIKRARSGYMIDPGDRDTPASCGCNDFIFTETGGAKWCRKCGATWMRGEFARWRRVISKHKTAPKKTPQVTTKDKTVRDLQYGETGYITGVAYVRKDLNAPVCAEPSTLYSYHVRRRNHGFDLVEIVPANKTVEQTAAPSRRGAPRRDAEIPRRQPTKKDRYAPRQLAEDRMIDATTRRWFWPLVAAVLMIVSGLAGAVALYDRWCGANLQAGITRQQAEALSTAATDAGAAMLEWGCDEGNAQRYSGGNR